MSITAQQREQLRELFQRIRTLVREHGLGADTAMKQAIDEAINDERRQRIVLDIALQQVDLRSEFDQLKAQGFFEPEEDS